MAEEHKVKVVTFKLCNCTFLDQIHLLVAYKVVDLAYGNAVAISYTWGEFDRRRVILGHDSSGSEVSISMGQEWTAPEVVQTLSRICREHARGKGCWMDQFCIPQNDPTERRNLVMQIPDIFRTLGTVIMLCGHPCHCFDTLAVLSLVRDRTKLTVIETIVRAIEMERVQKCWDIFGVSSYFQRVWTRQEFQYSSEISIVWSSAIKQSCVTPESPLHSMSRYAQQVVQRSIFASDGLGLVELERQSGEFNSACSEALWRWLMRLSSVREYDEYYIGDLKCLKHSLLAGRPLKRRIPSYSVNEDVEYGLLEQFFDGLHELGGALGHRSTTEPCDYVAAVWIDCPKYTLPRDYRSWELSTLLEDAIQQLESNFGISVAVSFPCDLSALSDRGVSGLWRPTTYLGELNILSSVDVYGPVLLEQPVRLNEQGIIEMTNLTEMEASGPADSLGSYAAAYPYLYGCKNAYEMIQDLRSARDHWPNRLGLNIRFWSQSISMQALIDAFAGDNNHCTSYSHILAGISLLTFAKPEDNVVRWWSIMLSDDFDCHAFAFGFVSLAFGLDPVVARKRPLSLVMTKTEPRHMGFKVSRHPDGQDPNFASPSSPLSSKTLFFGGEMRNVHEDARQLCDIKIVSWTESEAKFKIDITWVRTKDPAMRRYTVCIK